MDIPVLHFWRGLSYFWLFHFSLSQIAASHRGLTSILWCHLSSCPFHYSLSFSSSCSPGADAVTAALFLSPYFHTSLEQQYHLYHPQLLPLHCWNCLLLLQIHCSPPGLILGALCTSLQITLQLSFLTTAVVLTPLVALYPQTSVQPLAVGS